MPTPGARHNACVPPRLYIAAHARGAPCPPIPRRRRAFVILNLFIAILLESFQTEDGDDDGASAAHEGGDGEQSAADDKVGGSAGGGEGAADGAPVAIPPTHRTRKCCLAVVQHPCFTAFMTVAIVVSSATLAFDNPRVPSDSSLRYLLTACNRGFTLLFAIEVTMSIAAYDLFTPPHGYLLSYWNCVDALVVAVSAASLCPELEHLRILQLLRILRPLRLIKRSEGMKVIVAFFGRAAADILSVTGAVLFFQVTRPLLMPPPLHGCTRALEL